jgi:hypothetical protein
MPVHNSLSSRLGVVFVDAWKYLCLSRFSAPCLSVCLERLWTTVRSVNRLTLFFPVCWKPVVYCRVPQADVSWLLPNPENELVVELCSQRWFAYELVGIPSRTTALSVANTILVLCLMALESFEYCILLSRILDYFVFGGQSLCRRVVLCSPTRLSYWKWMCLFLSIMSF